MKVTANKNDVGVRLKLVRKEQGMTLKQVSEMTGVSISNLSKIENQQVSPSFDIIKRISDGLRSSLEDLVSPGEKFVVSGRKTVTKLRHEALFSSGQYDYRVHATELSKKAMIPMEILVRARDTSEFDHWSSHDGEEFVYVIEGAIEVHTEHYQPFTIKVGESAYFDSGMKHLYVSASEVDARVLSVSYDPGSGAGRLETFMHPDTQMIETSSF